jgi:hypothetical protein
MSFEHFLACIETPALREIAAHWRRAAARRPLTSACGSARAERLMPGWRDIDPAAIAPHLPLVWSWKYDRAADRFTGRLSGEAITAVFGRQLRGAALHDFFAGRDAEQVEARFHRIVHDPSLVHSHGRLFRHIGRVGIGERICMPLADDGEHADGILGATNYSLPSGFGPDEIKGERIPQQNYQFFALEAVAALSA